MRSTRAWLGLVVAMTLAACSNSAAGPSSSTAGASGGDQSAVVTVWTDATRQVGFEAFQKSHPDVKMKIVLYKEGDLISKIQLFNKAGSGWPDVVFGGAAAADPYYKWAADLSSSASGVLPGLGTSNAPCQFDGKTYCLVNDVSQVVLWYNKVLMDQFGYQVPKTWSEYEALGEKVAQQHPGYLIGTAGDAFLYHDYLRASGCPAQNVTGPNKVHIDLTGVKCTRVTEMLDKLIKAGSVSKSGWADPTIASIAKAGKLLMEPAPSWFGEFVFKPESSWAYKSGQLAAAELPVWNGEPKAWSGDAGGGAYIVSNHAKNMKGAVEIASWMATSPAYQATAPTFPAYAPVLDQWGAKLADDKFYAVDPLPVLKAAAATVNPVDAHTTRYDVEAPWVDVVVPALKDGKSITSVLPQTQSEMIALAKSAGYEVD